ncbi:MAG: hypothetical protein KFF77_03310, partial [Bacteroidetes bacterium]|nr:hypothetical protein [Bacteroidota bacterium]
MNKRLPVPPSLLHRLHTTLILAAVLLSGCAAPRLAETGSGPTIRVCIADRSQDVLLGIGEGAVI